MRKILVIALVALCAAFQGEVCAENSHASISRTDLCQVEFQTLAGAEVNDILLEWILNQVVDQAGMTYNEVRSLYDAGDLTIEKVSEGYLVTITSAEGGIGDIISIDEL